MAKLRVFEIWEGFLKTNSSLEVFKEIFLKLKDQIYLFLAIRLNF